MIYTAQYSFTRPSDTTQYGANELVANSTTAASVVPMSWGINRLGRAGIIRGIRLYKSNKTVTLASFQVNLFTLTPGVPTNGDNGAIVVADASMYLDKVAIDLATGGLAGGTTGVGKRSAAIAIPFEAPGVNNKLYGLLETTAAYTPASAEVFTVTLEIEV